jgi:twinkle protein
MAEGYYQKDEPYSGGDGSAKSMGRMRAANYDNWRPPETMAEIAAMPSLAWPERKITKETMERFGVKVAISEEFGPGKLTRVFFPYRDKFGTITGYKRKDITLDKHEKGHFSVVGHVGVDCQMFGQAEARKTAKRIYIMEGEVDTLSAYQALMDWIIDQGKYSKDLTPIVVGVGLGTVNAKEHIANNAQFFTNYKEVALAFDNDEVSEIEKKKQKVIMRGKEATQDVGSYFAADNVLVYPYPDWANDANEMLGRGYWRMLAQGLLFNLIPFQVDKVVSFDEVHTFEEAMADVSKGLQVKSMPLLMDKLLGFRLGELTVTTSFSGVGKSTLGVEVMYQAAMQGESVGLIMLEEDTKKTLKRFMARYLHVHPNIFKFSPRNCGKTEDQLKEAWDWVNEKGRFSTLDHFGSIKTAELMAKIRSLVFTKGCKYILFDHISLAVSGLNLKNERGELDAAMTELAAFCSAHDVHIIVVSHLNRNASTSSERNPKEPKWRCVYMEDLRGSSALEGLAWQVIGIDKEDLPDGTRGRMRLRLLKNREADECGECDILKMDKITGIFYNAENETWQG